MQMYGNLIRVEAKCEEHGPRTFLIVSDSLQTALADLANHIAPWSESKATITLSWEPNELFVAIPNKASSGD